MFTWLWNHRQDCKKHRDIIEMVRCALNSSQNMAKSVLHCTTPKHILGCLGFPVSPSWHDLDLDQRTPAYYQIDAREADGLDALLAADSHNFSSENRPSYSLQHAAAR